MERRGIDFFPMACQQTEQMELIEAQYGLKGFAVIHKLYQNIFNGEGYYCRWEEDSQMLFSRKNGLKVTLVSEIVMAGIRRGIFSKELYDTYRILTSEWIQETYFFATQRRKKIFLKSEYLLVQCDQIPKNADISHENVYISKKNADISEQSTVEDSKVKNSIVKEKTTTDVVAEKSSRKAPAPDCFADFCGDNEKLLEALREFESFRKKIKAPLTEKAKELLVQNLQKLSSNSDEQIEILNQSILNGWKGVFELRSQNRTNQQSHYQPQPPQTVHKVGDFEF